MGSQVCSAFSGRPEDDGSGRAPAPSTYQAPSVAAAAKPSPPAAMAPKDLARKRKSVSAEAYGAWNKIENVVLPEHAKSEDQKDRLKKVLQDSFLFASLSGKEMETTLMAMQEVQFDADTKIITEGEDGNWLCVIESGSVDCIKIIDGAPVVVKTCKPGDVFGELALLYNAPRAATVQATSVCTCWKLDRATFNFVVRDATMKRREQYDNILKSVAIIKDIEPYERAQLADVLKLETYQKGQAIVRQDEPGDKFYIIEEGILYAEKGGRKVMDYKDGDYFGELALLKSQPRAASVIVASDTARVFSIAQDAFVRLLGNVQGTMMAKADEAYKEDEEED